MNNAFIVRASLGPAQLGSRDFFRDDQQEEEVMEEERRDGKGGKQPNGKGGGQSAAIRNVDFLHSFHGLSREFPLSFFLSFAAVGTD